MGDGGFAFYGFFKPHIIPPEKEKVFCGGEACVLCLSSSCFRREREGKKPKSLAKSARPPPITGKERESALFSSFTISPFGKSSGCDPPALLLLGRGDINFFVG